MLGSWRDRKLEDALRLYSWLSEPLERERIANLGEVVYRAIVNISQIGSYTLYSAQIVRLVNPIFRPTGSSPRVSRNFLTAAVTREASSRLKEEIREENDTI
jgi:hypothetical protein